MYKKLPIVVSHSPACAMHPFNLPARITMLFLGVLFLFVACKKEIGETKRIASSREEAAALSNQIPPTSLWTNITEKAKANFPLGGTRIVQFESGLYFGVEKSKAGQKFVLIKVIKFYILHIHQQFISQL